MSHRVKVFEIEWCTQDNGALCTMWKIYFTTGVSGLIVAGPVPFIVGMSLMLTMPAGCSMVPFVAESPMFPIPAVFPTFPIPAEPPMPPVPAEPPMPPVPAEPPMPPAPAEPPMPPAPAEPPMPPIPAAAALIEVTATAIPNARVERGLTTLLFILNMTFLLKLMS